MRLGIQDSINIAYKALTVVEFVKFSTNPAITMLRTFDFSYSLKSNEITRSHMNKVSGIEKS